MSCPRRCRKPCGPKRFSGSLSRSCSTSLRPWRERSLGYRLSLLKWVVCCIGNFFAPTSSRRIWRVSSLRSGLGRAEFVAYLFLFSIFLLLFRVLLCVMFSFGSLLLIDESTDIPDRRDGRLRGEDSPCVSRFLGCPCGICICPVFSSLEPVGRFSEDTLSGRCG